MNTGNTGQRYKMAKLTSIRQESNKVIKTLSCGHEIVATWESPEAAGRGVEVGQHHLGKNQRCTQCQANTSTMTIDPERKVAIEKAIASEQSRRSLDEIYAIGLAYLIRGNGPLLKNVYGEEVRAILREHGMRSLIQQSKEAHNG